MYCYLYFKYPHHQLMFDSEIYQTINNYFGSVLDVKKIGNDFLLLISDKKDDQTLIEYLNYYITDNLIKTRVYLSDSFDNYEELNKHIELLEHLINDFDLVFKKDVLTFHDLLMSLVNSKYNVEISKIILGRYLFDNEIKILLKKLFDNNLNVLKTARDLEMHRNTVIYKLDVFNKYTKLDPRVFNEAFIIKSLLEI